MKVKYAGWHPHIPVRTRPTLPDSSQVSAPFLLSHFHTGTHTHTHTLGVIIGKVGQYDYKIQHAHAQSEDLPAVPWNLLLPVPLLLTGGVWIASGTLHLLNERTKRSVRGRKTKRDWCLEADSPVCSQWMSEEVQKVKRQWRNGKFTKWFIEYREWKPQHNLWETTNWSQVCVAWC